VNTMRTVRDPFKGCDAQISDKLTDRLRGQYACGPHLPNGNSELTIAMTGRIVSVEDGEPTPTRDEP